VISTYATEPATQWLHKNVFAVELKADPTIVNLAHTHVDSNGYWSEPHASVNRDFTRVMFNSNWDTGSDVDVDAYMVVLPTRVFQEASDSVAGHRSSPPLARMSWRGVECFESPAPRTFGKMRPPPTKTPVMSVMVPVAGTPVPARMPTPPSSPPGKARSGRTLPCLPRRADLGGTTVRTGWRDRAN
jgi:hypothetical protein